MFRRISAFVSILMIGVLTATCGCASSAGASTDYSKAENWLALPSTYEKDVDVFYLYPSCYAKSDKNDPDICEIDNALMRQKAKLSFDRQATAFETAANIYAPYYRQADAIYSLTLPADEHDKVMGGIPAEDAIAAFDYYIKNYNNGRPFFLAAHSQGSDVLLYLLSDYMKQNPQVYGRMIAAYVIGYSITDDYLAKNPHLKFAQGWEDAGVIISYNTVAPDAQGPNPVVLPTAHVINPITWTTDETLATANQSLGSIEILADGSVALDADGTFKVVPNYADAKIDKANGVLICSTADTNALAPGKNGVGKGIFHNYDYPFYYFDLQQNAEDRAQAFLKKQ